MYVMAIITKYLDWRLTDCMVDLLCIYNATDQLISNTTLDAGITNWASVLYFIKRRVLNT